MCYRQIIDKDKLSRPCKFAIKLIRPTSQVLEVGCATGYVTRELKNKGCKVTCIEIDGELAGKAKDFSEEIIVGDVEDTLTLERINKNFDYILFMDVLEHLRYPKKVLMNVKNFLNKKGVVIVNMPNIVFYPNRIKLLAGHFEYEDSGFFDNTHLRFYNYKTSRQLLEDAGYDIQEDIPFLYFPGEYWLSKIPLLGRLGLKITYAVKACFPNLFGFSFMYIARPGDK